MLSLHLWDLLFSSRSACFQSVDVWNQIYHVCKVATGLYPLGVVLELANAELEKGFFCLLTSSYGVLIVARYFCSSNFFLELMQKISNIMLLLSNCPKKNYAPAKYRCFRIGVVLFIRLLNAFAPKMFPNF